MNSTALRPVRHDELRDVRACAVAAVMLDGGQISSPRTASCPGVAGRRTDCRAVVFLTKVTTIVPNAVFLAQKFQKRKRKEAVEFPKVVPWGTFWNPSAGTCDWKGGPTKATVILRRQNQGTSSAAGGAAFGTKTPGIAVERDSAPIVGPDEFCGWRGCVRHEDCRRVRRAAERGRHRTGDGACLRDE